MAKLNSWQSSIICIVLKCISAFFKALPLPLALWLGRGMGMAAFCLYPKNRRKAYQHLRIAFGQTKSPNEIDVIVRDHYLSYGQNVVEVARLTSFARDGAQSYVEVKGREHVDAAMKKGRGLIFLSMHSGNWELSNIVGSRSGHTYNMVANYLDNVNKVADLLDSWRKSGGCRIINPGIGGRDIIKALKRNEIVTLVADQGGTDGILVPFFGRKASFSTGGVRIALKYDVPICLVDIHRLPQGGHVLEVEPFVLENTGQTDMDVEKNTQRIASRFEEWIAEHPCEYLWFYKTWKHSADRRVMIIDDGRTGHLRQSQAVARHLAQALKEKGKSVAVDTLSLQWRSERAAMFFSLIFALKPCAALLGVRLLKPFVTEDCFKSIAAAKPDYVVSCGSKNSRVNVLVSDDNEARNICILRPNGAGASDFRLVVLPRHDVDGKISANTVVTQVAPNMIDKKYLADNQAGLLARFSHLKLHSRPRIGLLLGGDTKGLVLTEQQVKIILHQLKEAAEKFSADILVTTSRRTSPDVEALVSREFNQYPRTALLILASRNNVPEAVGGILALCDVVLVSGESISMLSEAVMSGRKTIVFPVDGPDRKPVENKYKRFAETVSQSGHAVCVRTTGVADAVDRLLRDKVKMIPVDDNTVLLEAVRKIVI